VRVGEQYWEELGLRDAVLRGDESAWCVLYDRCFDSLYAFIDFRTGHRRERTEEAVQECWLIAVKRIDGFDPGRGSFGAWMRGIAANVVRDQWRKHQRTGKLETASAAADAVSGASSAAANLELAEKIGLALTFLPERYRTVLQAKYEQSRSVAEIARERGESPKAVESLLTRARKAFRQAWAGLDRRDDHERHQTQ
jgi:RNA polymerase sigma-70 factor (ECF subfamily)